ncbi:MAG: hypothetical protein ACFFCT_14965, partial [Candidatus Odinarchaeota archaeon]
MVGREPRVVSILLIGLFMIGPVGLSVMENASLLNMPVHSDIIVIQVGKDDSVLSASDTIQKTLKERNNRVLLKDNFPKGTSSSQITACLDKSEELRLLKIDVVETSVNKLNPSISDFRASLAIVVGHGTEDGLVDETSSLSWIDTVESICEVKQVATIFATCYGSNGAALVERGFGLSGVVDAIATAYIASAVALAAFDGRESPSVRNAAQSSMHRGIAIASGASKPLPLIP